MSEQNENNTAMPIVPVEVVSTGKDIPVVRGRRDKSSSPRIRARDEAIAKVHGASSLVEKMGGIDDPSKTLRVIIAEILQESDNLLGNSQLAQADGDLRDSAAISSKRVEALHSAAKVQQVMSELSKGQGVDVDSPSILIVFRFFFKKAQEAFKRTGLDSNISDLFFGSLQDVTLNWKQELRKEFDEIEKAKNGIPR